MRLHKNLLIGLVFFFSAGLSGQSIKATGLLSRDSLPPELRSAVDALGDRVVKPGNERAISTGMLIKGSKRTSIRLVRELPDKVRIEDTGPGGRALGFDGNAAWASDLLSDDDSDLMESLGDDSAETALYGLQGGYSLRLIGEHFRVDRAATANYKGQWLDIFELRAVTKQRSTNNLRQKYLVFDSNLKLLLYVRYKVLRGATPITVQTEWSGWRKVNGQAVPTRVGRRENGVEVWSFSQDQVSIGAAQQDAVFAHK